MKNSIVIIGLLVLLSGCAGSQSMKSGTITLENQEMVECPRGIRFSCGSAFGLAPFCKVTCYLKHGNVAFKLNNIVSVLASNK